MNELLTERLANDRLAMVFQGWQQASARVERLRAALAEAEAEAAEWRKQMSALPKDDDAR